MQTSLTDGLARMIGSADARVIHQLTGGVPWSVREEIEDWPGVAASYARSRLAIELAATDGFNFAPDAEKLGRTYAMLDGFELSKDSAVAKAIVTEGRRPNRKHEVMIDTVSAEMLPVSLGQRLMLRQRGGETAVTIVGFYELQRPRLTPSPYLMASLDLVRELSGRPEEINEVMIVLDPDQDPRTFCNEEAGRVKPPLILEPSELLRIGFDRRLGAVEFSLLIATIMGFLSCTFIIVTGLTTSVTEQQREMAITRCIGAWRSQLFLAQVIVGVIISAAGGLLGIPIGILVSWMILTVFGGDLPVVLTVSPLGILLAIIGSLAAGVIGAVYPAWLACRTDPMRAIARRAKPTWRGSLIIAAIVGCCLILLQLLLLLISDREARFMAFAWAGLPAVYVGYFLLAIPIAYIAARPLGTLLSLIMRLPSGVLSNTILATPMRQGLTAGTLMVGVAILVTTWANGHALLNDWVGQLTFADGFVFAPSGLSPEEQKKIADVDGIDDACSLTYAPMRVEGEQIFGLARFTPPNVIGLGVDPDCFFAMNRPVWVRGSVEEAIQPRKDGTGVILSDRFLTARGIDIGDTIKLGAGTLNREYTVVGLIQTGGLELATQLIGIQNAYTERAISCAVFDETQFRQHFVLGQPQILEVDANPEVDDEAIALAISNAAPGATWRSGRWILDTINGVGQDVLLLQSAIAAGALLVASLGLGNILLASIHARRYEYGVLRSIGTQRTVLIRMILGESIFLALIGAIVGTALGMHLAWVDTHHYQELAGLSVRLHFPLVPTAIAWAALVLVTCLVTVPGLIATVRPTAGQLISLGRTG